jgi:hypothetical protein
MNIQRSERQTFIEYPDELINETRSTEEATHNILGRHVGYDCDLTLSADGKSLTGTTSQHSVDTFTYTGPTEWCKWIYQIYNERKKIDKLDKLREMNTLYSRLAYKGAFRELYTCVAILNAYQVKDREKFLKMEHRELINLVARCIETGKNLEE